MKTFVAVAILALLSVSVTADDFNPPSDVKGFVEVLKNPDNDLKSLAFVLGYIWGVDSGMYVWHPCYHGADEKTTNGDMAQIFVNFMLANEDDWAKPGSLQVLTNAALLAGFPCEVKKEGVKSNDERDL